jgi:hypothetical protein
VGQRVRVISIISNDTNLAFIGTVIISENNDKIGSSTISLAVGSTQTVFAPWIPSKSGHTMITAQLIAPDGTLIQQVSQTFSILAIPIAATPSTSNADPNTSYTSSAPIEKAVASVSPGIAEKTKSLFESIDNVRLSADKILGNEITKAQQALSPQLQSLNTGDEMDLSKNTSTSTHSSENSVSGTDKSTGTGGTPSIQENSQSPDSTSVSPFRLLWQAYLYLLTSLRFLIDNAIFLYLLLLILILYLLCKLFRKIFPAKK